MSVVFGKKARDKEWGFTEASLTRFHKGNAVGVLICHGFGCTPTTMDCLYERAVSMGFTAVMPLLTGHAKTFYDLEKSGFEDWRRDVREAYARLISSGCERIILCGLSLGALLMAELAAELSDDPRIKGAFLICPPVKMKGYLNVCADLAWLIPYVQTADGFKSPEFEMYFGMATRKLNDIRKMARLVKKGAERISCPVTLIEAGEDSRVNRKSYYILTSRIPKATHTLLPGAPHGIPYSAYSEKLANIFEGFLATLVG